MAVRSLTDFFRVKGFVSVALPTPTADLIQRSQIAEEEGEGGPFDRDDWRVAYECPSPWRPRNCLAVESGIPLRRFVDGAARISLLAQHVDPQGNKIALVGGVIGAMAARVEGQRLRVESEACPSLHRRPVIAFAAAGYDPSDIERVRADLFRGGVFLLEVKPRSRNGRNGNGKSRAFALETARVAAHTRIVGEMRALELVAAAGADDAPGEITVVDGNLSTHMTNADRHYWPLLGVIKRHRIMPLSGSHLQCVESLRVGERTPAFVIESHGENGRCDLVSWYVKIRPDYGVPLRGTIRIEVPLPWLEESIPEAERTTWYDGVSRTIVGLRAVRSGYSREDCSIQPIVMIEDRLHAVAGPMDVIATQLRASLGL